MPIKKVTLIGATGNIGRPLLEALISDGSFDVTVVQRESSKSKPTVPSATVPVKTVDDGLTVASLRAAFEGEDAVVVSFPLKDLDAHINIAEAAAAAGVSRIIPADYGGCDSSSTRAQEEAPIFASKTAVRKRLQELTAADPKGVFSWTSLVTGNFFDWGLREKFLHMDLQARTADILDGSRLRTSTSTLARVADAVVRVLKRADDPRTRNRMLFVQSFCVTQLEILAALERATGSKWNVKHYDSEDFIKQYRAKVDAGDTDAMEDIVFALGVIDGDWEDREDFAMDLLGLENENLDEVVQRVVNSPE